jgi:hypothetical protein
LVANVGKDSVFLVHQEHPQGSKFPFVELKDIQRIYENQSPTAPGFTHLPSAYYDVPAFPGLDKALHCH